MSAAALSRLAFVREKLTLNVLDVVGARINAVVVLGDLHMVNDRLLTLLIIFGRYLHIERSF